MRKYGLILIMLIIAAIAAISIMWWPTQQSVNSLQADSSIISLSPNQVFKVEAKRTAVNNLQLNFTIASNYYIYQQRLVIKTTPANLIDFNEVAWPPTLPIADVNDPSHSEDVFAGNFTLNLPLKKKSQVKNLSVTLQGCDGKSICYPPQTYTFTDVELNNTGMNKASTTEPSKPWQLIHQFMQFYNGDVNGAALLKQLNLLQLMVIFFIAGIAIALTPCMYPLYPIALSSILGDVSLHKRKSIALLVVVYMHGLAIIYVLAGFFAAMTGKLFTTMVQTPTVMLVSAAIWLILGFAMFDLLEIKLPNQWQAYIHAKSMHLQGGKYVRVFVLGILSSIVLGPCVAPPLIAAIGFIVGRGDMFLGGISLYMLSLGMGVPIFVLAVMGNKLMPKSGKWMAWVKYTMGVLIIAVSIYLAYPFVNLPNYALSIAMLCFSVAILFLAVHYFQASKIELMTHKIVPIVLIGLGVGFNYYGIKLLSARVGLINSNKAVYVVETTAQLDDLIKGSQKPVIIDFYATWCTVCKEMEEKTFSNEEVQQQLNKYTVIKFDLSKNTPEQLKVLQRYGLYGPPALIILAPNKQIVNKLTGFVDSKRLISYVK